MSRTEKYLPYILALILPALGSINNPVGVMDDLTLVIPRYCMVSSYLLGLWFSNKFLMDRYGPLKTFRSALRFAAMNLGYMSVYLSINILLLPDWLSASTIIPGETLLIRLVIAATLFLIILETLRGIREREALKIQNLSLQSINLKAQLEALTQQVNPHFLFNSLNTLIELIEENQKTAVEFVRHFASMYRFVLQSSKHDLVCVSDELAFVDGYWRLLSIRFNEAIELHIAISKETQEKLIPPLSLQMVIENAIKHNEVSKARPLKIWIEEDDRALFIRNSLAPKEFDFSDGGFGLQNLARRFELTMNKRIEYGSVNDHYQVKLPLKN